jgi:hypothetical protein
LDSRDHFLFEVSDQIVASTLLITKSTCIPYSSTKDIFLKIIYRLCRSQVQRQIQAAFRLHADMGPDVVDDLFRDELLRLKARKSSLEARIHELEASSPNDIETPDKARKTIEINLADFKRAKSGASQIVLKRLMRRVIESIVLEPGRIALNYWTSNEERDERQTSKTKKASDSKSGANLIPFKNHQRTSSLTKTNENRDDVVFCSDIVGTGRGGGLGSCSPDLIDIFLENQS